MKTAVIIVALFGIVLSEPVQLAYEKCQKLNMDSTISVKVSKGGTEQTSTTVVSSPTDTTVVSGDCSGTLRTMTVYFNTSETRFTLTFSLGEDNMVSLRSMVQLNAKALFPGQNFTGAFTVSEDGKMELSSANNSYKCNAEQSIGFQQAANISGFDYDVTLMLKDLQVQAFSLPEAGFSEADECSQDEVSTADPSTADPTTADPSTAEPTTAAPSTSEESSTNPTEDTTEAPTTPEATTTKAPTTTAAPTTTEEPKPDVVTYMVKEDNTTCIKMVAAISVSVDYETTDNKTATAKFDVPSIATADGSCGNGTDTNATLTIEYVNDAIEFMFEDKDKQSMINSVTLSVEMDATRFPNAKDAGKMMNMTSDNALAKTEDVNFYTCIAGSEVKFESAMLEITQLKVQAFNLEDGDFSGNPTDCPADASTTASPTPGSTTTPKPEPSGPPVNNYTVGDNGTCLMMQASLVLDITYTDKDGKSQSVEVAIPKTATFEGTCGDTMESLQIKPFTGWMIEMVFSGASQLSSDELAADDEYQLSNLTVTYVYDNRLPNNNQSGKVVTVSSTVNKFEAPVKGSYKCNANVTIDLNKDLSLKTSNFRYQAFQANSTKFNDGDLQECNADIETNSIVPIAVGAALAGLVVIVLIAYLIGRRKSRRQGYESV